MKPAFRIDRTLGAVVAAWMESNLVHGPGDIQGRRYELDDEQLWFLLAAYALDDQGRRLVRRAVFSRPKGRAKSEFAAAITAAEALGPARFGGWDSAGRPIGRAVRSPFIPCAATEEGQADNVYAMLYSMLRDGPLAKTAGLDVGLTRTYLPGGGKVQPITARASSKDGGRETFAVFDETHLYTSANLVALHETIRRNLAKRKAAEPWGLEVTTMYAPDEGSVAEFSHRYAESLDAGGKADPGFLFDHRQAPADVDFKDDRQLRAALVECYGAASEWMDIDRLIAEARDPQTAEEDFRRYFLNQPTVRRTAWLGTGAWQLCADPHDWPPDGARVVLGFDGSYNRDSTALVGQEISTGYLFVVGAWERPEHASADWVVDRVDVERVVAEAMRRWRVTELACDPQGWHQEIAGWARAYGDQVVVVFETNKPSIMAPACSRFYSDVVNQSISHDGDKRLARHLANATTKETKDGAYITKDGRHSRKIDLAVAAVIAHDRAATKTARKPLASWA